MQDLTQVGACTQRKQFYTTEKRQERAISHERQTAKVSEGNTKATW